LLREVGDIIKDRSAANAICPGEILEAINTLLWRQVLEARGVSQPPL
jgi:hypothetical protein